MQLRDAVAAVAHHAADPDKDGSFARACEDLVEGLTARAAADGRDLDAYLESGAGGADVYVVQSALARQAAVGPLYPLACLVLAHRLTDRANAHEGEPPGELLEKLAEILRAEAASGFGTRARAGEAWLSLTPEIRELT
jgi:hypothetical protein